MYKGDCFLIHKADFQIKRTISAHYHPSCSFALSLPTALLNAKQASDFNTEYEKCLTFIKEAVKESTAKHIVVVTHHVPSAQCVAVFLLPEVSHPIK